ncbi:MAG: stage II sporulation protein M [Planctomycetes bacterium]|nr:stage II sporulation protein M [Planctomycetota bacterium]
MVNPVASTQQDVLQDRTMAVETPEHVSIEYPLAGLGSRFAALLADLAVIMLVFVALCIAVLLTALMFGTTVGGAPAAIALILGGFSLLWGYFFVFEAFRDGQTPGKRWLSIRVVMDGGYPLTVEAAAIRNLIRIIDIQGAGMVGGFFMLLGSRAKRLGDLAASTVVVRELPVEFPEITELSEGVAAPRLNDPAFAALEKYVDRRTAFDVRTRDGLASQLVRRLGALEPKHANESDDAFVVRFHAAERACRAAARLGERAGSAAAVSLLRAKRNRWERFRREAKAVRDNGLRSLGEEGVGSFAARYRELTADLARARTYGASAQTIYALERLVGAGHNLLYRPARQSLRRAGRWLWSGFPRLVRRRWLPIAVASALLYAPGLGAYVLLRTHPEFERQIVSADMISRAEAAPARRAAGTGYVDPPDLGHGLMSTAIISNNVRVAFLAFAAGVSAGVLTAVLLVLNGISLGSSLAVFANRHVLDVIGVFVMPHGVIELTAICIAGGAGLWMGSAFLLPGRKTRRAAFAERAKEAIALIGGVAVMLLIAGTIEGFVSPSKLPDGAKLAFAGVAALALVVYLVGSGRGVARADAPSRSLTTRRDA